MSKGMHSYLAIGTCLAAALLLGTSVAAAGQARRSVLPAAPALPAVPAASAAPLAPLPPVAVMPELPPAPLPGLPPLPPLAVPEGQLGELSRAVEGLLNRLPALPELFALALEEQDRGRDRTTADARAREEERGERQRARAEGQYERARQAIENAKWAEAVQGFTALAQAGAGRADAAMYWRAYALDKMNLSADALSAVAELVKSFPDSRWLSDARALELQMRQRRGQPVAVDKGDDDLKLLAIQALQQYSPEKAVPLLTKVLAEGGSVRLKERALFVLAQSSSPEARAKLAEVARGSLNPDLQLKAVQFLGMSGQAADRQLLNELYTAAAALDLKRQVLRAFMMAGDRQRILAVATSEKTPELRTEAVRQLGMLGARDDLWQMYQKETVPSVKRDILQALGMSGATARLIDVVNSERDPDLKVTAVRQLGMTGGQPAASALMALYAKEQDPRLRRAAIDALFMQGNADGLVSLARKETDPGLRRELVQKLSMMGSSPAALEYLTELLNK